SPEAISVGPAFSSALNYSTQATDLEAKIDVNRHQATSVMSQVVPSLNLTNLEQTSHDVDVSSQNNQNPIEYSDSAELFLLTESLAPSSNFEEQEIDISEIENSEEFVPTTNQLNSDEVPGSIFPGEDLSEAQLRENEEEDIDNDELFEEVFGQPRNLGTQQVVAPIFINNQQRGQTFVQLFGGSQADILIEADDLLIATAELVRPDIQAQLSTAVDNSGQINLRDIRQTGLEVTFDERRLELQLQIPPPLRATSVSNVDSRDIPSAYHTALRPSYTSGYLNIRGGQNIVWTGETGETGRQPLLLSFDGALNMGGWVLEGSLDFDEGRSSSWQLGDVSLVHDDIANAIRYRIGDLSVPIRGYQSSIPMAGITIARNFSLQPFRVTRPISRFEFFLERRATVDVFVNNQLVQTLRLEAGPQDVRDLPLNAGINGVQLVITDDLGQIQRLDFATGFSGDLLAPGMQQFAYSLGIPSQQTGFGRQYDISETALTLSHRFGATEQLTLGGYFQGNLERQLLGFEGTWATNIGNWTWDAAISHDSDVGWDLATRVFYDFLQRGTSSRDQRTLRVGLEYRGENFITLGDESPSNSIGLDLTASYSQVVLNDVRVMLNGRYQLTRNKSSDAYEISLGLAMPLGQGLNLNLNGSYGADSNGETTGRLNIGLLLALPQQRQTITSNTTLDSDGAPTHRMNWNYSSRRSFNSFNTSLGLLSNTNDVGLTHQTRYQGYRALLNLENTATVPRGGGHRPVEISSRLTWGTAFVFADGVFGWSRPIDNSFAIIARQGTAENQLIRVNPGLTGEAARADGLGAAVLPIQPYALTTISLDAPNIPTGYDLGEGSYTLFPTYRSGILITAGTEATVFIRGVIQDASGNPFALQRAVIESLSDSDWPDVEIFTNRVGRFASLGLKPGRYRVRVLGVEDAIAEFTIPEDISGTYEVAPLTMPSHTNPLGL
ncbi:MAG: fimbria/pilus outer membrane usher protein, partial [Cyanobacteria bacterium P01_F01_bin.86]